MNWDSIKSILKLSIPLIISQLGLFFVQLSDTVMVGQIGSRDLGAISFGGNVYFFIYIFGIGIVSVGVIHDGVSTTFLQQIALFCTISTNRTQHCALHLFYIKRRKIKRSARISLAERLSLKFIAFSTLSSPSQSIFECASCCNCCHRSKHEWLSPRYYLD